MPELNPEIKAFLESLGASSEPLPADDPIYTSGAWVGWPRWSPKPNPAPSGLNETPRSEPGGA